MTMDAPRVFDSIHTLLIAELSARFDDPPAVQDAWTVGAEEVVLHLDRRGELHLLLVASIPLFWIEAAGRRRPSADTGFGEWLQRRTRGERIVAIDSGDSRRVLRIQLNSTTLVLDPGAQGSRLLAIDERGRIEQRFPPAARARASGRAAPGEIYGEPAGGFIEPWRRLAVDRAPTEPPADANVHSRSPLYVCAQPSTDAAARHPIFLSPLPCARSFDETVIIAGPLPPLEAAREAGRHCIRHARVLAAGRAIARRLRAERAHLIRLTARLAQEAGEAGEAARCRREAEALLANAARVKKGMRELVVEDPAAPGGILHVRLDPQLAFGENVARLFQRARRLTRAEPQRRRRSEQAERLLARLAAIESEFDPRRSAAGAITSGDDGGAMLLQRLEDLRGGLEPGLLRRWSALIGQVKVERDKREGAITRAGYRAPAAQRESEPASRSARAARDRAGFHPRRFELPGGWTVLVARSSRENDRLTHRFSDPADLWFHAQSVPGSHVILRRGRRKDGPSRETLAAAAAIAAYFSKARTSGMAPVIFTERRYVRKPRGGRPGLAICQRERMIMVEPHLPVSESADPAESDRE